MSWPTTDDPRTEFITLRLTVGEAADLDAYRQVGGFRSRSAAVRDCVDRVIAAEKRRKARQKGKADG
jgi:Arc/MetJ-type ribon-helix-helix transcriptional regulator